MVDTVTRLIVDANNALRVLDGFEQAMEGAGKATEYTSGAVADYEKRMAAANERIAKGQALTIQRVAKLSDEEYAMRRLHASVDSVYKLRFDLERKAQRAAADAAYLVSTGRETQENALRSLMLLEQQHNAQLTAAVNATKPAIAANDNLAQSYKRVAVASKAAKDNASHNVSNLAAQFQDIAVTSAMGMSPLQIALQQGTQISAVLGPMGAAGAVKGLGAAFLSILNPVSLVVIALVAAAAAAIQYVTSLSDNTKKTEAALKAHAQAVSGLKEAYGEAASGAREYLDETKNMATALAGISQMKMGDVLKSQVQGLIDGGKLMRSGSDAVRERLEKVSEEFGRTVEPKRAAELAGEINRLYSELEKGSKTALIATKQFAPFSNEIDSLVKSINAGNPNIVSFREAVGRRLNLEPNNIALKKLGDEILTLVDDAYRTESGMKAMEGNIRDIGNAASKEAKRLTEFGNAMRGLADLGKEPVSDIDKLFQDGIRNATSIKQIDALVKKYEEARKRLEDQNPTIASVSGKTVSVPSPQERPKVELEGLPGTDALDKASESYKDLIKTANDRLRQMEIERDAIGRSSAETEALRMRQDLLTQAMDAQGHVAAERVAEIDRIAKRYGELAMEIDKARFASDILFEREQLGRTDLEKQVAVEMRRLHGDAYADYMDSADAGYVRFNETLRKTVDEMRALDEVGKQAFEGIVDALTSAGDAGDKLLGVFAGIGKQMAQMGTDRLWKWMNGEGDLFGDGKAPRGYSAPANDNRQSGGLETALPNALHKVSNSALDVARQFDGLNARADSKVLDSFMQASGTWKKLSVKDTAWCAAFANAAIIEAGGKGTGSNLASSFLNWGQGTSKPNPGDIVVLKPQAPGASGHVGFLVGYKDGKVQLFGGNQSKGANVKSFGADQVVAYRTDASLLKGAVSDGLIDATRKTKQRDNWAGLREGDVTARPQGSNGGGNPMLKKIGALLGSAASGYQSADPIGGAINGALSGLAMGSPGMAVIGAIIGGVSGYFGKRRQKKKERQQAQNDLAANRAVIDQLFALGEGRGVGSTTQSYHEFYAKTAELDQLAQKAGDSALVGRLRNNVNSFFVLLEKDFNAKLPGMMEAFRSGFGADSPFLKGAAATEKLRDELKNFVADAQSFGDLQLFHKRDLTPEQLAQRVRDAQEAAQKMALASITGVEALSGMETEMLRLKGAATAMQGTLEQLGMNATDAAKAIDGALSVAVGKLRRDFMDDINASLNRLSGVSYLNEIVDAQKAYDKRLKDSAALGIDGSYALKELSLSIRDIVKQADLSKTDIDLLSQAFPQVRDALKGWSVEAKTLVDAKGQLQVSYDKELSALESVIDKRKSFIDTIKQFREAMRVNATSPLGPRERVDEAARQFRTLVDKARLGDEAAQSQLTSASQTYLDEAKAYYASSTMYVDIWTEVERTLGSVQTSSEDALATSEKQLTALKASVSGILQVNDSVLSVKDALAQYLKVQQSGSSTALRDQAGTMAVTSAYRDVLGREGRKDEIDFWRGRIAETGSISAATDWIANSPEAKIKAAYQNILGRSADAAGLDYWMKSGKSVDQIEKDLAYAKVAGAYARGGIVGAYATGGRVGNGIYNVDSVRARYAGGGDIMLAGGEHVTRATSVNQQTAPILDHINRTGRLPGNDNGNSNRGSSAAMQVLIDEVAYLNEQLAELRGDTKQQTKVVAEGAVQQIAAMKETNATLADVGSDMKRAVAK